MKFCDKCGHKFTESERFCPVCGNKRVIRTLAGEKSEEPVKPEVVAEVEEPVKPEMVVKEEEPAKPQESKKKWLIPVILVILLALVGSGIYAVKSGLFDSKEDNTEIADNESNKPTPIVDAGEDEEPNPPITPDPVILAKEIEYAIHNATLVDNTITATVTSISAAHILAEVYSEDLKELIEAKKLDVAAGIEMQASIIELEIGRPENFAYRVRLVDDAGEDLCAPFIDVTRTTAYARMEAKTPEDFEPDKLIELGSDANGGFFVIDDDIVLLKNGENAAYVSYDEKKDVLILKSVAATLAEGNKVVVLDEGTLVACITVKNIEISDEQITISGWSGDSLTNYFKFFRLNIQVTEDLVDEAEMTASAVGGQGDYRVVAFGKDDEDAGSVGNTYKIPYDSSGKVNFAGDANLTGGVSGEAEIAFFAAWDKDFLPDNTYFTMSFTVDTAPVVNIGLGFGREYDGSVDELDDVIVDPDSMTHSPADCGVHVSLMHVGYNLGDSKWAWLRRIGENFVLDSDFAIDITGELEGKVEIEVTNRVNLVSACDVVKGSWGIPKAEPRFSYNVSDPVITLDAKAEANFFAGLKYQAIAKLSKFVELSFTARAGATADATADAGIEARSNPLWAEHPCLLCCNGEAKPVVDFAFEGGVKTSWNIFDKEDEENVEVNMLKYSKEVPFDIKVSGYASLVHDPAAEGSFPHFPYYFGMGDNVCPNELKKVTFIAKGKEEEALSIAVKAVRADGLWDSDKGSENPVVTDTANDWAWFYPGTYTVSGEYEGQTVTKTFKVPDNTTVTLDFGKVDYYKYIRDEILPEMGYADLSTLSGTIIINQYYNGEKDWYNNKGILSANICDMNNDDVEDCVLFYVDLVPDTTHNAHSIYAQVYTAEKGNVVPLGERYQICEAGGTSHKTVHVGICEINGQSYIYKQDYGYSMVAAGGQQPSISDYFYGIVDGKLDLIMYTGGSRYDYQDEREIPAGLRIRISGLGFEKMDCSADNYNREVLEYLGFSNLKILEYSCPETYHKMLRHSAHKGATLWGSEALIPSFTVTAVETYHDSKGGGHSTIETTLKDYSNLQKIISELPE